MRQCRGEGSFAEFFNGRMGKLRCAGAACSADIFSHAAAGDVHLPEASQNFFGAGVVMGSNESLQLGGQSLGFP